MSLNVLGIECPMCRAIIWSRHRHDFRHCSCGYSYVDGGRDYLRYGWGPGGMSIEDQSEIYYAGIPIQVPTVVRIEFNPADHDDLQNITEE